MNDPQRPSATSARTRAILGAGVVALTGGLLAVMLAGTGGPEHAMRVGLMALLTIAAVGLAGLIQSDPDTMRRVVLGQPEPTPCQELAARAFRSAPGTAVPSWSPVETR